jgi:hypothetical protein
MRPSICRKLWFSEGEENGNCPKLEVARVPLDNYSILSIPSDCRPRMGLIVYVFLGLAQTSTKSSPNIFRKQPRTAIPMDSYGFLWIPVDFYGFLWSSKSAAAACSGRALDLDVLPRVGETAIHGLKH